MNGTSLLREEQLHNWRDQVALKVERLAGRSPQAAPHVSAKGVYDELKVDQWISGFWPGLLWLVYGMTGKESLREEAWGWDEKIEKCFLQDNHFHHDVGFQFLPTAVIKYKLTGDEDAKRRGLAAANFLAGRFNVKGGFLRAWPNKNGQNTAGWAIIDCMMNLSLLFWASEVTEDPRYRHMAVAHADTAAKSFIREDGSARHVVVFDPETGECKEFLGGQGYAPESAWSRGQAWALYGFANTYRYTGDVKYLHLAQRVAHYFLSCLPEDSVPHWDFRAPNLEGEPRDTSAGAIALSGLLDLAEYVSPEEGWVYRRAAEKMMLSLSDAYSTWDRPDYEGILLEATGHKPAGANINVSLIYGDYYYTEALAKLLGWEYRIF